MLIAVAAMSKAWVCGRSLDGIAGSVPTGLLTFVSCECCVLSGRRPCVGLIVIQRSSTDGSVSEYDREALAHQGLLRHKEN